MRIAQIMPRMSKARVIELEAEIARLRTANASLTAAHDEQRKIIDDLMQKLEVLHFRVAQMSRRIYANTSERHDPNQQTIFGDAAQATAAPATTATPPAGDAGTSTTAATETAKRRGGKRPGEGRLAIPVHLREVEQLVELTEAERLGVDGTPLVEVDRDITYKMDYEAGGYVRRKIVKIIYGRPFQESDAKISAPMPACIVPGGKATDELILHLLHAKYGHHLPLNRLEEMAREAGIELPRSTIMDWVRAATDLLAPVAEAIKSETLAAALLHVDETPVRQLDPGSGKCRTARFWVYRAATGCWFHYTENRQGEHPQTVLADYAGFVAADAYAGFDRVFAAGKAIEIACWAHVRRKFFEALHPPDPRHPDKPTRVGDPRADQALAKIRELYRIEREIAGLVPDERQRQRHARSRPILDAFKALLDAWAITCRPTEPLAKAVTYASNQWDALIRFVDSGIAPIDNNPAENALRPIAVGRKNWLFTGSPDGGAWAAIAYTLIQSARINGLNPATYLADTVKALLAKAEPAGLTPARVLAQRKAA
jgi:transposase/uncharacterized coiled-coil protein SlyX